MTNILKNAWFNEGTYEIAGQVGLVLPLDWSAGYLDEGNLYRASRGALVKYGYFDKYGPQKSAKVCLKPEILAIKTVPPYLSPARTEPPSCAVTGFKLYGVLCWWLMQTVPAVPGQLATFNARAHAWSRLESDPNTAEYSNGVGTAPFFALENSSGLNDGQRNYTFKLGIDPFGGADPFGSAVIWGRGAHIYNRFDDVPTIATMARADSVTVFVRVTSLWGMINSNAYISRPSVELTEIPPEPTPEQRGAPRIQYARKYHVLPLGLSAERVAEIRAQIPYTDTTGGSYDDAGIGDLDNRTAVLWDIAEDRRQEFTAWYSTWYPGVKITFQGVKVEPPVPPPLPEPPAPPVMVYKRPSSMGGLHVTSGPRNGYGDFLRNCNRSVCLQSVNDFGALQEAKEVNPDTVTVIRLRPASDEDTPPGNWQWPLIQTHQIAVNWMSSIYPQLDRNTFKPDYVGFVNEPDPADIYSMARASDFMLYCMEDAEAHGVKLAIWAWTAGLPRTPRIKLSDSPQAEMSLDSLRYAAENGHCLSVHDGSVNASRRLFWDAFGDGTALRYRILKTMMDEKGWPMPPVIITEAYQDGFDKNPDWNDLAWYLSELAKDPYVLGSCLFTVGDYSGTNISGQLAKLADLLAQLPIVTNPAALKAQKLFILSSGNTGGFHSGKDDDVLWYRGYKPNPDEPTCIY